MTVLYTLIIRPECLQLLEYDLHVNEIVFDEYLNSHAVDMLCSSSIQLNYS